MFALSVSTIVQKSKIAVSKKAVNVYHQTKFVIDDMNENSIF